MRSIIRMSSLPLAPCRRVLPGNISTILSVREGLCRAGLADCPARSARRRTSPAFWLCGGTLLGMVVDPIPERACIPWGSHDFTVRQSSSLRLGRAGGRGAGLVILDLGQQVDCPRRSRARTIFLGVFGVEREHTTLQAEALDQLWRGRNLVALLRDHQMAEHDLIGLPQRRHHVRRLAVAEGVETA